MSARPKLTVATSFPIHPARGGGQTRVVGLYGAAAALGVDVDVVALADRCERPATRTVRPGLREIRVPKSDEHNDAEHQLRQRLAIPAVTDIALGLYHELTPAYAKAIGVSAADSSAVVACHPYPTEALLEAAPGLPLLYEAQDVEIDLKAALLAGAGDEAQDALAAVRESEALACARATQVLACSAVDADRLAELFGLDPGHVAVVPNGYDATAVPFTGLEERAAKRRAVGVEGFLALFVGSWHGPNVDAARAVCEAAAANPDMRFLIVGSVGLALEASEIPPNVDATGMVHEAFLRSLLALADVAVNPMSSGSGTNLKMIEYAGGGIPLVSSSFGARGLGLEAGRHYLEAEPDELAAALRTMRHDDPGVTASRVRNAYQLVIAVYDWPVIARRWLDRAPIGWRRPASSEVSLPGRRE